MKVLIPTVLCFFAFSTGCALDPPQQKSGITQGCAGIAKNAPACQPAADPNPVSDDGRNKGAPAKADPVVVTSPAQVPPTSTTTTTPTTSSNPFGSVLDKLVDVVGGAIQNSGSGGGGGGTTTPTSPSNPDTTQPSQTTPASSGQASPSTTASVTLTTKAGVYFKKNFNTSTSSPSPDFCLVAYGTAIKASCVSSYTETVYYVTGANACPGLTAGYIYKSSVDLTGTVSTQCR
ncbi:hypothetical protein EBR21_05125 [bacterium]|nr:hypothetical protein [bacterium]